MFATPKLLSAVALIVVGLVLLLVESLEVIVGGRAMGTADKVLLWVGFGLIAAGAATLVWALATETPADQAGAPAGQTDTSPNETGR